jgi:hypothetical protein
MSAPRPPIDQQTLQRIYSEFMEMPGMRVTSRQAQRLWGLDERACRDALEFLLDTGFLYQPRDGIYMRTADHETTRVTRQIPGAGPDVRRRN